MYYIQHTMDKSIKTLPAALPPSLLKSTLGSTAGPGLISSPVMSAQTLPRQVTGNSMSIHNPAITRQMTGSVSMTSSPLAQQLTGGASNLLGAAVVAVDIPWDITPEDKSRFDRFFDQLDKSGTGVLGGSQHGKSTTCFIQPTRIPLTARL